MLTKQEAESRKNTNLYNSGYIVNTNGIGNKEVKLKLEFKAEDFNAEINTLALKDTVQIYKQTYEQISYNGEEAIKDYDLSQNYPNPFNPTTTIKYQVLEDGAVSLKIYDILGNEIRTLVNEQKTTGRYEVKFDANDLASGVYIYRMKVNDFVSSKKLIMLK
jgi:hypothetical protein